MKTRELVRIERRQCDAGEWTEAVGLQNNILKYIEQRQAQRDQQLLVHVIGTVADCTVCAQAPRFICTKIKCMRIEFIARHVWRV